jgi:uncharacterized damage-inducible protein DinB
MTHQTVALLATEMDDAWETLYRRLDGLTDAEFFWEPVSGCWTVHRAKEEYWVVDYADPAPDPPPFTTIAWRLLHLAECKVMYYEYAFGARQLTWEQLPVLHTATEATAWLEQSHARLRSALNNLSDADLEEMRLTNWGEPWPTWRIFWSMVSHDLHHGAEIGCLRDLYRAMHQGGR